MLSAAPFASYQSCGMKLFFTLTQVDWFFHVPYSAKCCYKRFCFVDVLRYNQPVPRCSKNSQNEYTKLSTFFINVSDVKLIHGTQNQFQHE